MTDAPGFYYPHDLDGDSVVVIRESWRGYTVIESGFLSYDGTTLLFRSEQGDRVVDCEELNSFKVVSPQSRIAACQGFRLFRIVS